MHFYYFTTGRETEKTALAVCSMIVTFMHLCVITG